jgi:predicted YcjX-like family ATPase
MEMRCAVAWLAHSFHKHVITGVVEQYLKENIAGALPTFMKAKMAFIAPVIHLW